MKESLFNEIINISRECIFWKDKDRRFMGANQAFLDFYGFESVDEILGRNDEDMGWHSDPVPYMADELKVLSGQSTYKVPGKCIVRGEERNIVATKRPLYSGGKIVGLIGCFTDVTNAMRKRQLTPRDEELYSADRLRRYEYFDGILEKFKKDEIMDGLTGTVSRVFTLEFARNLIEHETAFSFILIDIDNLEYINDTYGYRIGDLVLMDMAASLVNALGDRGIVGRFGDDELLIVNTHDITYDERKAFLEELYGQDGTLCREVRVDQFEVAITATASSTSYPIDTAGFDDLLMLLERTAETGKKEERGRYVIYSTREHGEVPVNRIKRHDLYSVSQGTVRLLERTKGFENKLNTIASLLMDELRLTETCFVDSKGVMRSLPDRGASSDVFDIPYIMNNEIFPCGNIDALKSVSPMLHKALARRGAASAIIARVGADKEVDGYFVGISDEEKRVFNDYETGLLYFLTRFIAVRARLDNDEIS
ncbi:MAG: GGDEF domain-containing protein [Lachnospiraceae bacterium]|nr:GGDEF domain-containing protein [Lachnospiraceae bacterium]